MYSRLLRILLVLFSLGVADPIRAAPIVQVSSGSVGLGGTIALPVSVSVTNELIGAYDLTLVWNTSLLEFETLSFGPFLDGPLDSFQDFLGGAGSVRVTEFSFLAPGLANQSGLGTFTLFTLSFRAVGTGLATVGFAANVDQVLGDELGLPYADPMLASGLATVREATTSVPEPATLGLLVGGLGLLRLANRKRGAQAQPVG
ncbi:MAG: cohesin domain-containing protein [Steroidobacteraceae bacterium]|jgi:hypothetical protein|nr:cohesin domain-containing protein [Steroidobacteraceae bacterium]